MSGVRIKDLQSAKPLIEQHFNEMEFVVDLPQPDATLKMSGADLPTDPHTQWWATTPGASIDPEVIAPLSKLKSMMTGGGTQNIQIALNGQLTAKGRDLMYVLGKENFKIDVLGG